MEQELELPAWLVPDQHDQKFPRTKEHRDLTNMMYESLFERVLEALEEGEDFSDVVKSDPRPISSSKFRAWIRNNPERQKQFDEAELNGTRVLEDRMLSAAKGSDSIEDVQRSKLYVDTIWKILQIRNRRRYGVEKDSASADKTINITISQVESPYKQITSGVTIDG